MKPKDRGDTHAGGWVSYQYRTRLDQDDLQSSKSEDPHQAIFLPFWDLQTSQYGDRYGDNNDIRDDVEGRVAVPECKEIHAVAPLDCFVPKVRNRDTCQVRAELNGDAIGADEAQEDPAQSSHLGVDHKSQELKNDRTLDYGEAQVIHGYTGPERL